MNKIMKIASERRAGHKVLVTGGLGYIGSHMVLELLDRGIGVVVLDDLSTGTRAALPAGVPLVVADIADSNAVIRTIRDHDIDSIAHFAARIVVPDSIADPLAYYNANTVKSRALIESVVACGVRNMIFSSTAAVYGDVTHNPVHEKTPTAPISPYGRSKLMTEWMLEDASRAHGLRHVALRYFNVAGADPKGRAGQSMPNATHLIKVAMQAALGLRPCFEIFGDDYDTADGTCERDFIHVSDLARAHICALGHLWAGGEGGTFNCGYGRGYSVRQIAEVVRHVSGVNFEIRTAGRRPGDAPCIVADNSRIRGTLGWTPALDEIGAMIRHAWHWECGLLQRKTG